MAETRCNFRNFRSEGQPSSYSSRTLPTPALSPSRSPSQLRSRPLSSAEFSSSESSERKETHPPPDSSSPKRGRRRRMPNRAQTPRSRSILSPRLPLASRLPCLVRRTRPGPQRQHQYQLLPRNDPSRWPGPGSRLGRPTCRLNHAYRRSCLPLPPLSGLFITCECAEGLGLLLESQHPPCRQE